MALGNTALRVLTTHHRAAQDLLKWAQAVLAMAEVRSKPDKTADDTQRMEALGRLIARERLKVEMFVAKRMAEDNARLRRMVNNARRTATMAPPRTCSALAVGSPLGTTGWNSPCVHLWPVTADAPDELGADLDDTAGPSVELSWRLERDSKLRAAADRRRTTCIEWASKRGLTLDQVQQVHVFLLQLIAKEYADVGRRSGPCLG